ncbi:MAG: hypothetical protein HY819_10640 [Acidobacteria bacterium]|nr:hypothetical protein [Acidobacteriota bacterium]
MNNNEIYLEKLLGVDIESDSGLTKFFNLAQPKWYCPPVKLEGDFLTWKNEVNNLKELHETQVQPNTPTRLINAFIKLTNVPNERLGKEVLKFAKQYGVLGLCKHGLPHTHHRLSEPFFGLLPKYCPIEKKDNWCCEPIDRWRYYARLVNAVINVSRAVDYEKQVRSEDWVIINEYQAQQEGSYEKQLISLLNLIPRQEIQDNLESVQSQMQKGFEQRWANIKKDPKTCKLAVASVINQFLVLTDVRPIFVWLGNKRYFRIGHNDISTNLLSLITTQLMLLLNGSKAMANCASCGNLFILTKYQSIKGNAYCSECNQEKPRGSWQKATKKYQENNKEHPNREKRKPLSSEQVKTIRNDWLQWKSDDKPSIEFYKQYSQKYSVTERNIRKIVNNEIWKDI